MHFRKGLLLVAALALATTAAHAGHPQSFDQALEKSAKSGKPVLLKVGTSWCSSCKAFDEASATGTDLATTIGENALLYAIDAEKGEGITVARTYNVDSYPTFLLVSAEGETMDRWMGFYKEEKFEHRFTEAVVDPLPVSERVARFRETPNEADALKLGDLRLVEGFPAEATAYYTRANSLNPSSETDYDLRIFGAMARGAYSQLYSVGDLTRQADVVLANANASEPALMEVMWTMQKVSMKTESPGIWHPYLKAAYERTSADGKYGKKRAKMAADYALHIENDARKAVELKRANQPEGWMDNANQLNNFAWWCFENRLNIEEATELAERGVELAAAGTEKANVLDTLAELCNVNNDCANAVGYIRLAIQEDPENEYFQKQLTRFEEILAMQE